LGIPAMAVSLVCVSQGHYETAARVAAQMVERFEKKPIAQPCLLNINVPDVPFDALRGTTVTRLGKRHKAEPVVKSQSPRGETVYWVGAAGGAQDAGPGTDFHALANGQVSITPLQIDLTHFAQLDAMQQWVDA
jgi:5'-nucleotidase